MTTLRAFIGGIVQERPRRLAWVVLVQAMAVLGQAVGISCSLRETDRIAVLEAGRVVENGTWSELSGLQAGRLQSLIRVGAPG